MNAMLPSFLLLLVAAPLTAQDTLRLPALHEAAMRRDPRMRQAALQDSALDLRLRSLTAERLPRLSVRGEAVFQSEVAGIPVELPGADIPRPPHDRYAALLEVEQLLYDGGVLTGRGAVERARLEVVRAELATALHPLRTEVDEAFFTAFLLQQSGEETATLLEDLTARLAVVRAQAGAGAALPGDTAAVQAELLRATQRQAEIAADRRAALAVLGGLTGLTIEDADVLLLPALPEDSEPLPDVSAVRLRPEYARFAAERERLAREEALIAARSRPRVSAFGQAGYGRPGLEQFTDEFHGYGLAGIRVGWTPWSWGTTGRDAALLQLQKRIVETEEAAFTARLGRQLHDERESMARLRATLATDERIIALREQIERQARVQLDERAITAAAYLDARTDLQDARLARQRHLVELARARARYATTLGIALP